MVLNQSATAASVELPSAERGRMRRLLVPAAVIGGLTVTTVGLHLRDPHVHGTWGLCPSAALFGIQCPGCGGLRAVNDLTNGDVIGAASSNLLFVLAIPLILFLLGRWVLDAWRGTERTQTWLSSWPVLYAGLGIALVFTVLRNLPQGAWLAP